MCAINQKADLATGRELRLTTGKRAERTKHDFRCPICCSAIGQVSCLIFARRGRGRLCSHPLPTPSLFSLVTSLCSVPAWSEHEERVKWRSTKNWKDSEKYPEHKTIANQQWFPQHANSRFATTWQGGHVGSQNNRIFSRRIFMKKEFSSQRSKALNIFKNHC